MLAQVREQLNMLGIACRERVAVAPYTTFHIGGEVALMADVQTEEQLIATLRTLHELGARGFVLGRGSNMLFADEPMPVCLIRTAALHELSVQGESLTAQCGATLAEMATRAQEAGLGGLEFAHGIPGTLGGALCMNAGAYGAQMSDVVRTVRLYDAEQDRVLLWSAGQMNFSYRHSAVLARPYLTVLGATLALHTDDPCGIDARMQEYKKLRRDKQPLEYPSAGSVFKRPEGHFAGALIEQSGLKGCRIGGAMVSPKHAGFIVNVGGATAEDVKRLVEHIRSTVARDHGVELEPEIQIWNLGNER